MGDGPVNGFDGALSNNEAVTHSFRMATFVFGRQGVGEIATIPEIILSRAVMSVLTCVLS